MSIFTATVPTFSEEDERKELAALGEEERKRLHAEICGATRITTPTTPSASVNVESAEVLMREAVESLSARDKAAYVEAMKRVPKLVERESSFLAFLECEAWNPWAAAARLARYWTFRKRTFGNELAFLPMTQKGAMRQDIELLERQAFVLPLESDSGGRPVVVWDRIRASPEARSGVMRCLFYVTSKMGLHEGFSSNGFVVLLNYQVS